MRLVFSTTVNTLPGLQCILNLQHTERVRFAREALLPVQCEACICNVKNGSNTRAVPCGNLASSIGPNDVVLSCDFVREGPNMCGGATPTYYCCGKSDDPGVVMNDCKCA